jgi:hypothetical protein
MDRLGGFHSFDTPRSPISIREKSQRFIGRSGSRYPIESLDAVVQYCGIYVRRSKPEIHSDDHARNGSCDNATVGIFCIKVATDPASTMIEYSDR